MAYQGLTGKRKKTGIKRKKNEPEKNERQKFALIGINTWFSKQGILIILSAT